MPDEKEVQEQPEDTSKEEIKPKEELYDIDDDGIKIRTSVDLDIIYSGHIESLTDDVAIVSLVTSKTMVADRENMVHSGFIGSTAEYAALIAVNEPTGMVYGVNSQYFACVRVGEEVKFTATIRHVDSRKREVDVIAKMDTIKIYEAKITIVIPEYHPLKIQLLDVAGAKN